MYDLQERCQATIYEIGNIGRRHANTSMLYSEYCKSVPGTGSAAQCFGPDTAVVSCILLANMSDRWHVPAKNMSGFRYEKYAHFKVL